jgi:hypothetical protein
MSSDPQPPHPPDQRTRDAFQRLSRAVWAALLRLDAHEQRAKAQLAAPPDASTAEQQPLDHAVEPDGPTKDPTHGDQEH